MGGYYHRRKFTYDPITDKSQDLIPRSLAPEPEPITTMIFWHMLFSHVLINPQISFGARLLLQYTLLLFAMNCIQLDMTLDKMFYLPDSVLVICILSFSKNKLYMLIKIWWQTYE